MFREAIVFTEGVVNEVSVPFCNGWRVFRTLFHQMNRTSMEHRIASLERTIGDHEIHRLVPLLSDEDLIHACQLITSFDKETISCETLDFELDVIFDKYRESPVNLAV